MKKLILGILGLLMISSIVSLAMADTLEVTPEGTSTDIRYFDGSVGIGTTGPGSKLDINGGTSFATLRVGANAIDQTSIHAALDFYANNAGNVPAYTRIGMIPIDAGIGSETGAMTFSTLNSGTLTEKVRILNNGNVGIGTTGPNQKLTVAGNVNITGTYYGDGSGLTGIANTAGINVKEFGAKGDGGTDDTAAFNAALVAANKTKPLFLPPGNYIISNLVLQGTSSGGAEEGKAFGLIGSGVGTTTITASGGSGVFIQVGASTDPAVGYRRFVMRDLKIVGNSGYSEGIQIGNYNGASPVTILGEMRNIETTSFTDENASGVFIQNAVSFNINNLYSYSNYFGIKIGSNTIYGSGPAITTINIQNSQFRLNTYGAAIFQALGVSTYNNVYEANSQWGMLIKSFISGAGWNSGHFFLHDWYEANTVGSVYITSSSPGDRLNPTNLRFLSNLFSSGTDVAIKIDDGSDFVFENSDDGGANLNVSVADWVPRVLFLNNYAPEAPGFNEGVSGTKLRYLSPGLALKGKLTVSGDTIVGGKLNVTGGTILGEGTAITKHLSATTSWDPASINNGAATATTITVSGAALGDTVVATFDQIGARNMLVSGHVQAADTVRIVIANHNGGAVNLASGTARVDVWKH